MNCKLKFCELYIFACKNHNDDNHLVITKRNFCLKWQQKVKASCTWNQENCTSVYALFPTSGRSL